MEVVQTETGTKFKWVIEKFSQVKADELYSEEFCAYGQIWRLLIFPKGNDKDGYLSLYLEAVLPRVLVDGWSRYQRFSLSVVSQLESTHTVMKEATDHFTVREPDLGYSSFMLLSELKDLAKGFLVNDVCIVEADVQHHTDNRKIRLKLLVDKKRNRVVFAESNAEFVDILLSFLTMPLGRVQKLLGENSSIGCIPSLYDSVHNVEHQYFTTDACQSMLLNPLSEADRHCENLTINLNNSNSSDCIYICNNEGCFSKSTCCYSYDHPNVNCICASKFCKPLQLLKLSSEEVFVKRGLKFIVTDDLHIMPASTSVILSLLANYRNEDQRFLEEMVVDVGYEEVLNLLRNALSSESPLTKLSFSSSCYDPPNSSYANDMYIRMPKTEPDEGPGNNIVKVNLLLRKDDKKVVHMEGDEEMANLMFSFLLLPLGSVVKLLNKSKSLGCIDNIYSSAESLCSQSTEYIISEDCKRMLLNPKLAPFFSCTNQIIKIDEAPPYEEHTKIGCYHCYYSKTDCLHYVKSATLKGLNPKSLKNDLEKGGGYAKETCKFAVTNDLSLFPYSPISIVGMVSKSNVSFSDLVEKQVTINESMALNLLKAALVSKTALDDAFAMNNYDK